MANTNQLALCLRCGLELDFPLPRRCPHCSFEVRRSENNYFKLPNYVSAQYEEFRNTYKANMRASEHDEKTKEMDNVTHSLFKWCRECTGVDKIAAMSDAHLIIKHLLHSDTSAGHIKKILDIGKKIGDLCSNLDDYFKKGGTFKSPPTAYKERTENREPRLDINDLDINT